MHHKLNCHDASNERQEAFTVLHAAMTKSGMHCALQRFHVDLQPGKALTFRCSRDLTVDVLVDGLPDPLCQVVQVKFFVAAILFAVATTAATLVPLSCTASAPHSLSPPSFQNKAHP